MRLGIIARCDRGGLAAQTLELTAHLFPARVLEVHLGQYGRGAASLNYRTAYRWFDGNVDVRTAGRFLRGLDAVLTVEGWYGSALPEVAERYGIRRVLVANPELYRWGATPADTIITPTDWELGKLPEGAVVLPHPINLDRFTPRVVDQIRTWYHLGSPAMLDRNGTRAVRAALDHVQTPCKVVLRDAGCTDAYRAHIGRCDVWVLPGHATPDYWTHWPEEADAFLLPRRYGGLCLPMQEAAALGLPVVALGVPPQDAWFDPLLLVPPSKRTHAGMPGGRVRVYDVAPERLAARMDTLMQLPPDEMVKLSAASRQWAEARSWDVLLPQWQAVVQSS